MCHCKMEFFWATLDAVFTAGTGASEDMPPPQRRRLVLPPAPGHRIGAAASTPGSGAGDEHRQSENSVRHAPADSQHSAAATVQPAHGMGALDVAARQLPGAFAGRTEGLHVAADDGDAPVPGRGGGGGGSDGHGGGTGSSIIDGRRCSIGSGNVRALKSAGEEGHGMSLWAELSRELRETPIMEPAQTLPPPARRRHGSGGDAHGLHMCVLLSSADGAEPGGHAIGNVC